MTDPSLNLASPCHRDPHGPVATIDIAVAEVVPPDLLRWICPVCADLHVIRLEGMTYLRVSAWVERGILRMSQA